MSPRVSTGQHTAAASPAAPSADVARAATSGTARSISATKIPVPGFWREHCTQIFDFLLCVDVASRFLLAGHARGELVLEHRLRRQWLILKCHSRGNSAHALFVASDSMVMHPARTPQGTLAAGYRAVDAWVAPGKAAFRIEGAGIPMMGNSSPTWDESVCPDLSYVEYWLLLSDGAILARTVKATPVPDGSAH